MSRNSNQLERLHDLLADEATVGIDASEEREMLSLLAEHPDVDRHSFELAATALDLAFLEQESEPLPASVRLRLETAAIGHLAGRHGLTVVGAADQPLPAMSRELSTRTTTPRSAWLPWLAAAACLAIAAISWWPSELTPSERYETLGKLDATGQWAWASKSGDITGDVVWNNDRQEGVMRLSGLDVNDPTKIQYQLWIFDDARNEKFNAVDGGVFDIDRATGDVYVPIRSALKVFEPTLFAITSEPPGGVVKHDTELNPELYTILVTAPVSEM